VIRVPEMAESIHSLAGLALLSDELLKPNDLESGRQ
jgi:hypothetical protein